MRQRSFYSRVSRHHCWIIRIELPKSKTGCPLMTPANHEKSYPKLDYDQYARTLPTDDLWGQVKRTVAGNPVDGSQIEMIVEAIRAGLQLTPDDNLLDIGCGNGVLSR